MIDVLRQPWPWWVAGPLLGLVPAALLLVGNRVFGMSSNLRHACALIAPRSAAFFAHDWKKEGGWNLAFALGTLLGGLVGGVLLADPEPIAIAARTRADLEALGVRSFTGLVPGDVFAWSALSTVRGFTCVVVGGFL
ncbi:MAG: YeeE/YedE family protein, partial [Candidatus Eisenbacteria bacterium]